ncbi:MAG: hypothetical protein KY459_11000 [Acidobacteria bacterium]|nr:hypothetical protein [Acidobacteriota bacterium]
MRTLVIGIAAVLIAVVPILGYAQSTHEEYEVVLLPVFFGGSKFGAHGSLWVTEFTVYNGLSYEITTSEIAPLSECVSIPCPIIVVPPHSAINPPIIGSGRGLPGKLLRLRRDVGEDIAFALRVRDISRNALTAGTEIPVVRERDLKRSVVFLDIPLDGRFRQHLRIYDSLPHEHCVDVTIRYFDMESSLTLLTDERRLMRDDCSQPFGSSAPNAVELSDLASRLPGSSGSIGIEITAKRETDRISAFVSVTNNETQHVTIVTPQ